MPPLLPFASTLRRPLRTTASSLADRVSVVGASDRPVFVGACPRSGTTLFRSMLNAHPDLALPRETHFVMEAYRNRHKFGDLRAPENKRKLARWLVRRDRTQFDRLEIPPDDAVRALRAAPPTLGSVIGTGFKMFAEQDGKARWGDKRPMYGQRLPELFAMFPDAQVVLLVRDPRAVVASMKKLGWPKAVIRNGSVGGGTRRWLNAIDAGQRGLKRYRRDQVLQIRYEDLVTDPASVLSYVCGFLGLDDSGLKAMLEYHVGGSDIPTPQQAKYHPKVAKPVTDEAVRSWTTVLTDDEIAQIERMAGRQMVRYGYQPTQVPAPRPSATLYTAAVGQVRSLVRPAAPSDDDPFPVAARLTSAQRRRHAMLRRIGLER